MVFDSGAWWNLGACSRQFTFCPTRDGAGARIGLRGEQVVLASFGAGGQYRIAATAGLGCHDTYR